MTTVEFKNDFDEEEWQPSYQQMIDEKSNLVLTVIFTIIIFLILGIQIMPYFYGGTISHTHGGGCAWPNNCKGIHNL